MRATLAAGMFLGLHVILTYWRPFPFWGADFLVYFGPLARASFMIVSALLLIRQVREYLGDFFADLLDRFWRWPYAGTTAHLGLVLGGTGLFILFRASTSLLGDGRLYLTELDSVEHWSRVDNAPLTFWLIRFIHSLGPSAELTYQIFSYAGGMAFLALSIPAAKVFGRDSNTRLITLGFLLTGGYVQLFFGYFENYALILPAVLLFLYCSCRCLDRDFPLWPASAVLGCSIPLHFSLWSFLPALAVLAWQTRMRKQNLIGLAAAPLCAVVVLQLIGFDLMSYVATSKGVHFLPVWGVTDALHPYRMFSGLHLLNFANQQLLVAPAGVLTVLMLRRAAWRCTPIDLFLMTAAGVPLLFTFTLNPEIGAFRDWDALAVAALPFTVWAANWICRQERSRGALGQVGFLICGVAVLHTVFWVGVNTDEERSVSRFTDMLERGGISAPARAYGWETVGIYYREGNDRSEALTAYQNAIEANPTNPRYWAMLGALFREDGQVEVSTLAYGKSVDTGSVDPFVYNLLGNEYLRLGDPEEAIAHYQRAIELNPAFAEAYYNLGNLYLEKGNDAAALTQYSRAVKLRPGFAEAYYNAGNIYLKQQAFESAIAAYRSALAARPDFAQAHYNLGNAAVSIGKTEMAIQEYKETLSVDPGHANAHFSLGRIYHASGRIHEAKPHYNRAMELNPKHPATDSMKIWAKEQM